MSFIGTSDSLGGGDYSKLESAEVESAWKWRVIEGGE